MLKMYRFLHLLGIVNFKFTDRITEPNEKLASLTLKRQTGIRAPSICFNTLLKRTVTIKCIV